METRWGRGDDGYGIVRADGSSQKPVEKFLENYVSRFNLRQCVYELARKIILTSSGKFDSSLCGSLDFYPPRNEVESSKSSRGKWRNNVPFDE